MSNITRSLPLSAPTFWTFVVSVIIGIVALLDQGGIFSFGLPLSAFAMLLIAYVILLLGVLFNRL